MPSDVDLRVVGLHGHEFDAYKFRTMIPNAEAYLEAHPELKEEKVLFGFNLRDGLTIFLASQVPPGTGLDSSSSFMMLYCPMEQQETMTEALTELGLQRRPFTMDEEGVQVMQAVSWPRPNALNEMPLITEETGGGW